MDSYSLFAFAKMYYANKYINKELSIMKFKHNKFIPKKYPWTN